MPRQNNSVLLQIAIPWEFNDQAIISRQQSFFWLILGIWNYKGETCKTNPRKILKILFKSNYWSLCQNSCSWNMFWKEDQRICSWNLGKYMYSSSSLLHKRWFCKILSTNLKQKKRKKKSEDILVAGCFHANSKFISKCSPSLQRRKSFM